MFVYVYACIHVCMCIYEFVHLYMKPVIVVPTIVVPMTVPNDLLSKGISPFTFHSLFLSPLPCACPFIVVCV